MRIGVKFSRTGLGRFLSHLDLQDMFSRAVRRAGIPAQYSSGFHPHMNMAFASAMAVGLETEGDYFELQVQEDLDCAAAKKTLAEQMPAGFAVCELGRLPEGMGKLMALAVRAEYKIMEPDAAFSAWLAQLLEQESFVIEKQRKGKTRQMDLRPLIYEAKIGQSIRLMLGNFGAETVTPKLLIAEAEKQLGGLGQMRIVRKDLYAEQNGEYKALSELFV